MYQQIRGFNQNAAGKVVGLCLANVRQGYGIPAKYADAWQAWENTDQHTGTPPSGVAVPLFYSWDGPSNGHVNVGLGNGQVWSDGVVYASIADFEATHTPKYVGWSTSIDGDAVVQAAPAPAPTPTPTGLTIFLPATTGPWHLYKPGGPYNPNNSADVIGVLRPSEFGGLTYPILASLGNGVYRIQSEDFGIGDLWTSGSDVVIS